MKIAVQFGAGNIGRGFMGQFFFESGYKTIFVEAREELVELLNKKRCYPLRILDAYRKKSFLLKIENIEAVSSDDTGRIADIISTADVISTAVGVKNLATIAPAIAEGIKQRYLNNPVPVDVYLCENILNASALLRSYVLESLDETVLKWANDNVGFVGTAVARMVPQAGDRFGTDDPLLVVADSYHKLAYDEKAVRSKVPGIDGIYPVRNFKAEVERKLFVYNLGHAALAYLGYLKGYTYVHETINDSECFPIFDKALDETSRALLKIYPADLDPAGHEEVRRDIRIRYGNPMLMDTIQRVGRDPIRKLGPEDRLVGSAKLCLEQKIFPENIAYICAAALCYDHSEDREAVRLQKIIKNDGVKSALEQVSKLDPQSRFSRKIIQFYNMLRQKA